MSNRCIRIQFAYGSSWQHPRVNPGCTSNTKRFPRSVKYQFLGAGVRDSLAAIFTRPASESALIFCITLPRCA
jgi:hypothetical protein